jgi:hypothetical protein
MQEIPAELAVSFKGRLDRERVPEPRRPDYFKWVKFYLYFCQEYGYPPTAPTALEPFLTKRRTWGGGLPPSL